MALITQSYVHGASSTPLIGETIGQNLRRVTAEGPERLAQITRHQGVRWTYADLLRRSEDLAVGLRKSKPESTPAWLSLQCMDGAQCTCMRSINWLEILIKFSRVIR